MAKSVTARRSALGSRSAGASRRKATHRRRHKEENTEPDRPNVSELRQLREAYFGQSHHRARASTRPKEKSTDNVKVATIRRKPGSTRKEVDRTIAYVYATARSRDDHSSSSRSRHDSGRSPPSDDGMSTILEHELTPDDSVSQMGGRRRRRNPMKSTLRSVTEKSEVTTRPKRESIFGSLFSRRPSTTATEPQLVECLTCGADDVPLKKSAKLACGHRMCHSCLKRIFRLSVQDPAHMPPKCCTEDHIPLKYVDSLFDLRFKLLFNKKFDEYRTRNRVYCANRRCGIWIRPAHYRTSGDRRYAQCNRCSTKVCISCGLKLHRTQECPKDPEFAKLVEQAERSGWKRCYSCKAMVELKEGCNHMTCRCTAQFCMLCGAKWKTCDCPWFSQGAIPVFEQGDGLPDPFAFLHRQLFGQPQPAARPRRTYQEEMDHRRRQEQTDQDLARRMQFANIWE